MASTLRFLALLATALLPLEWSFAQSSSDCADDPLILTRIVQGLQNSKLDRLTCVAPSKEENNSYHLKAANYLGTISWKSKTFTVAAVKFIRSSNKGSEYPPARGHSFIVLFDASFKVASFGELDYCDYHISQGKLMLDQTVVVDFSNHDELTRYRGYFLGGTHLPYPFDDRISEADWESGAFRKAK